MTTIKAFTTRHPVATYFALAYTALTAFGADAIISTNQRTRNAMTEIPRPARPL